MASNTVRKLPSLMELSNSLQEKGKLSPADAGQTGAALLSPTKSIGRLQLPTRSIPVAPAMMARSFSTNSMPTLTRRGSIPTLANIEQRFGKPEGASEIRKSTLSPTLSTLPESVGMAKSKSIGAEPTNVSPISEIHPLSHGWTFYADTKQGNKPPPSPIKAKNCSGEAYTASMACIGKVETVQSFARLFNWMKKPTSLTDKANLMCFKDDIAPIWECPENENGGKWTVAFNASCNHQIDYAWLDLILALIGGILDEKNIVTGIVANIRLRGNRIQLWVRDKTQIEQINALGRAICTALGNLTDGQGVGLDFSAHSGGVSAGNRFLRVMATHAISQPLLSRSNSVPNLQGNPSQQKPLGFSAFMPPMSPTTKRKATEPLRGRSNIENIAPVLRN